MTVIEYKEGDEKRLFDLGEKAYLKWRDMGMLLDMSYNSLCALNDLRTPMQCWISVLQRWLHGQGSNYYPVGWDGLYELLDNVELPHVAQDLRTAVENAGKCST